MIYYCESAISSSNSQQVQMDNGGLHGMNGYQGGGGYNMEAAQPNGNGRLEEAEGEAPKYSDINLILDQILSMSDQSVDEAQVKSLSARERLSD